jgi:hypothetical protein
MRLQDRAKNNFCASGTPVAITQATFAELQNAVDQRSVSYGSPNTLPADRSILRNFYTRESGEKLGEGTLVRFAAFVRKAHYSNVAKGEAVSCHSRGADNNDINVSLGQTPDDDACNSITAEISPHFRPSAWNEFIAMNIRNNPVRVTGPLFFDASHRPCSTGGRANPQRLSVWEIHPVYALEVCRNSTLAECPAGDDSNWTPLDQWYRADSQPAKITVHSRLAAVAPGREASFQVMLRDANNLPSPAAKDMQVVVEAFSQAGTVLDKRELSIKKGQPSSDFTLRIKQEGIVQIRAKNRELLDGTAFIMVTSGLKEKPRASHAQGRLLTAEYVVGSGIRASSDISLFRRVALLQTPGSGAVRAQLVFGARTYLADGKDSARIEGWLHQPAEQDIELFLSTDLGAMGPIDPEHPGPPTLVIPKGGMSGSVFLKSTTVGLAHVRFMGPQNVDVEDPRILEIRFGEPITKVELDPSPPTISLVETSSLVVALTDDASKKHRTETDRRVHFLLRPQAAQTGRGEFDHEESVILAGNPDGKIIFLPYWPGTITVVASIDNLPDASASLEVSWPLWHLVLTALGGLVGGIFAYWVRKGSRWWRVPMGAVTGFILYWAIIFILRTQITHSSVLNPLSAFGFAAVGGWLGTEVFSLVLKIPGLRVEPG